MFSARTRLGMVGAAAVAAVLLAACSSSSKSSGSGASHTSAAPAAAGGALVSVTSTPLGSILVDSAGKTIYFFAIDSPNHSACTATCLSYWPIVSAPTTVPASVPGISAKLGSFTRPDGVKQLTIDSFPVYTFSGDSGPGMTSGQGKNLSGGLWWVVSPAGTSITSGAKPSSSAPSSSSGRGY
jgi:predicted lipoprotein with Yx(FWY)xxD motif